MALLREEMLRLKKRNDFNSNMRKKTSANRINGIEIYEMSSGINN